MDECVGFVEIFCCTCNSIYHHRQWQPQQRLSVKIHTSNILVRNLCFFSSSLFHSSARKENQFHSIKWNLMSQHRTVVCVCVFGHTVWYFVYIESLKFLYIYFFVYLFVWFMFVVTHTCIWSQYDGNKFLYYRENERDRELTFCAFNENISQIWSFILIPQNDFIVCTSHFTLYTFL